MKDYIVRPYKQGDEEEIVQLLIMVFEGWPHFDLSCAPLDHWRWKFKDNPLKMSSVVVGVSNTRIIGCMQSSHRKVKIGRKSLFCSFGADLAVHPDYRRMGVYTKLNELRDELFFDVNLNLVFGASSVPVVVKKARKDGWIQFEHPVLYLLKIHDVSLHLKKMNSEKALLKKIGYHFLNAINVIRNTLIRPPTITSKFHVSEISRFDDEIDVFWNRVSEQYSFIVERSRDYLNWRYCDPRAGDYVIKQAYGDGCVLGYIVLRINRYLEDYPVGYIVDLLALPDRLDVADALIMDAVDFFDSQDINVIHNWVVNNHPYEGLFKRHGLLNARHEDSVHFKPYCIGSELDNISNALSNQLHFAYGDVDWI